MLLARSRRAHHQAVGLGLQPRTTRRARSPDRTRGHRRGNGSRVDATAWHGEQAGGIALRPRGTGADSERPHGGVAPTSGARCPKIPASSHRQDYALGFNVAEQRLRRHRSPCHRRKRRAAFKTSVVVSRRLRTAVVLANGTAKTTPTMPSSTRPQSNLLRGLKPPAGRRPGRPGHLSAAPTRRSKITGSLANGFAAHDSPGSGADGVFH